MVILATDHMLVCKFLHSKLCKGVQNGQFCEFDDVIALISLHSLSIKPELKELKETLLFDA